MLNEPSRRSSFASTAIRWTAVPAAASSVADGDVVRRRRRACTATGRRSSAGSPGPGRRRSARPRRRAASAAARRSPSRRVGSSISSVCRIALCHHAPAVRALFWISAALLAWAQAGYGLFLAALRRLGAGRRPPPPAAGARPRVSLIVAAYSEQAVIAAKVAQRARARLAARAARGDRRGRRRRRAGRRRDRRARARGRRRPGARAAARAASTARRTPRWRAASGELLAFSDANALWEPDALRHLAAAFADPEVGYACGQVRFVNDAGTNQEGLYWRYEMWLRAHESALASVTAGNGAIYAVRAGGLPRRRPGARARPLVPVQHRQARPPRGLRGCARARRRRWSRRSRASGRASGG